MTAIRAHFDGKVLVPDEPVNLPVNQPLEVFVASGAGDQTPLMGLAKTLSEFQPNPDSPVDGAAQHDHYLYGTPKRQ